VTKTLANCDLCNMNLQRFHFTCFLCRLRKWTSGNLKHENYVRKEIRLLMRDNPEGALLVPRNCRLYIMAINRDRDHAKVKNILLRKILSFCENVLAN